MKYIKIYLTPRLASYHTNHRQWYIVCGYKFEVSNMLEIENDTCLDIKRLFYR